MSEGKAYERVKKALPKLLKRAAQRASMEFAGFVGAQMQARVVSKAYRTGASDSPFENATNKNPNKGAGTLRVASGRLFQSFTRNKPGNHTEVTIEEGAIVLKVSTDVPYAAIHEYGGSINHPGGTPYMIVDGGRILFLKKGDARAIGVTKGHVINIPARPYVAPALAEFEKKAMPAIQEELLNGIVAAFMGEGAV